MFYYVCVCLCVCLCVCVCNITGPDGEGQGTLSPVGTLERRGLDTYRASVTKTTSNHGDTYTCTASNRVSSSTKSYAIATALAPTNVTWEQIAPTVIYIRWLQPEGGAPVHNYTIIALFGEGFVEQNLTLNTHCREVTIQQLDGSLYTISIIAMSDDLPGVANFTAHLSEWLYYVLICMGLSTHFTSDHRGGSRI